MFKKCKFKRKKAQHVVELALFAPFIMIFIGVVTDIAYAMHSNYKFNASVYEAIGVIAPQNKLEVEEEDTVANIETYSRLLARHRFTPYWNTISLELVKTNKIDFIIGTYSYTSAFTIMNAVLQFTPGAYTFYGIIPVNSAILRKNSYEISNESLESAMGAFYENGGTDVIEPDPPEEDSTDPDTDPTDPTEPTDPTDPIDPTEPTEPTDPGTDPIDPGTTDPAKSSPDTPESLGGV